MFEECIKAAFIIMSFDENKSEKVDNIYAMWNKMCKGSFTVKFSSLNMEKANLE